MAASDVDYFLVESRDQLRDVFPLLQAGLNAIQQKGMSTDICVGDLYHLLLAGQTQCVTIRYCGKPVGFFVVEVLHEHNGSSVLSVPYLFVDCHEYDLTTEVVDEIEFLASEKGCGQIRFKTTRVGWERRLAAHGFEPTAIELAKCVGG